MPHLKPSRILHIHTLPVVSGSGINTLLTIVGSSERGHHVALACESRGRLTEEAEEAGVEVHLVPSLGRELSVFRDLASVIALAKLIRAHRFDVVHTHNSKAGFVGRLAAWLTGVPLIIHTVHGFAFHDAEAGWRRLLFRTLERVAARWCHGMIFISTSLEAWARRERIGLNIPTRVIYSGIDVDAFRNADASIVRRELGIPADTLVVGIISKLWDGKGHRVLFNAWQQIQQSWKEHPHPLLLVVGEGPLDVPLRQLAVELKIADTVIFTGFRTDVPAVTAAIDVAVLPSAFEGMGRVVLEAMAAGKPVVASKVGGIPDLVHDGITGFLVPPNESEPLRTAIRTLLENRELRQSMSESAASSLDLRHSSKAMVEEIHRFYDFVSARVRINRAGSD